MTNNFLIIIQRMQIALVCSESFDDSLKNYSSQRGDKNFA